MSNNKILKAIEWFGNIQKETENYIDAEHFLVTAKYNYLEVNKMYNETRNKVTQTSPRNLKSTYESI